MKFCPDCSEPLRFEIPSGDDRHRHVCMACGTVHYQNPKVIAGCLPVFGEEVLLCRRAIEPRLGFWTLPAGFMELGESVCEAARREAWEEAQVNVQLDAAYTLLSLPGLSQVYVFYRATMDLPEYGAGSESLEVRLFREEEIPWDTLAFETVRLTLKYFFSDRREGIYRFREEVLPMGPRKI
ncbi:MAG TPA: NUDIX hydrolase [Methylococcaceae bacterium]|nr:NUDIX hydrolase [Methylococcaceae bacterium]